MSRPEKSKRFRLQLLGGFLHFGVGLDNHGSAIGFSKTRNSAIKITWTLDKSEGTNIIFSSNAIFAL